MLFSNTTQAVRGRAFSKTTHSSLLFLFACLLGWTVHAAPLPSPVAPVMEEEYSPVKARDIPSISAPVLDPTTYVINGSFNGSELYFSATMADGGDLPAWISLEGASGVFTVRAPAEAIGRQFKVVTTATDARLGTATSSFYVNVIYNGPGCFSDANTDRLGKILDCTTGTVRLRGWSSTDEYRWTGPDGFVSSENEPLVSKPGLYVLTSAGIEVCQRRAIVEVRPSRADCADNAFNNRIPQGEVSASTSLGVTQLEVQFDAFSSDDLDGDVIIYLWTWEGGTATGARPLITFEEGTHLVTLTVMDNTGAKSTTLHNIVVHPKISQQSFWLEAECAQIGSNWNSFADEDAAGGFYVAASGTSMSTAPATAPENYVRFTLENADEGTFALHARISAAGTSNDSYWLRVNGGNWQAWNSSIKSGIGFAWNRYPNSIILPEGDITIDFAYREEDTRLDKLFFTELGTYPAGTGQEGTNCAVDQPPVASASTNTPTGAGPLAVTLDGSGSFDKDGHIVAYAWSWAGGEAYGALPRPTFPVGIYAVTLTVTDDDGLSDTEVITLVVNEPTTVGGPELEDEMGTELEINLDGSPVRSNTELWLEAECALVGENWETISSPEAAGGNYVVATANSSNTSVPADLEENRVRFSVIADTAGTYRLFARIDAPGPLSDSYYVRVNEGAWYKWKSGIKQQRGFAWNQLPTPLELLQGSNTIDFAYRERDTRLDKIYLTTKGNLPTGMGETGLNCGINAAAAFANEAECAQVGEGWKTVVSAEASGGSYLVYDGQRSTTAAAENDADQLINFRVKVAEAGEQQLYFRINAPDGGRNSIWVRINNGNWMKFWEELGGAQLLTNGFEWRQLTDDGRAITMMLTEGVHTVTVANREPGTMLDKVFMSASAEQPTGMGPQSHNCSASSTPINGGGMMSATANQNSETNLATAASIFPNPTDGELTLKLDSDYTGRVSVWISDLNGRRLLQRDYDKLAGQLTGRFNTDAFPAGMYLMRIWEGERQTVKAFVKK